MVVQSGQCQLHDSSGHVSMTAMIRVWLSASELHCVGLAFTGVLDHRSLILTFQASLYLMGHTCDSNAGNSCR